MLLTPPPSLARRSFANISGPNSSISTAGRPTERRTKGGVAESSLSSPLLEGAIAEGDNEEDDDDRAGVLPKEPLLSQEKELPSGDPSGRRGSWSVSDFRRNSENISLVTGNSGLNVTFSGLNYAVNAPKNTRSDPDGMLRILSNAEGRASAGEMVALMGASGAGKSTLLDILAGRKTLDKNATLTGTLLFNGSEVREYECARSEATPNNALAARENF